jgi:hypothetical protein
VRVFHYTVGKRLLKILEDGEIKFATAFIGQKEKPVVWFSTNQEWEQTVNKGSQDKQGRIMGRTKEETEEMGKGLIRIEVAPQTAPYTWEDYKLNAGVDKNILSALEHTAKDQEADPREWRVSFETVKSDQWISIEKWDGKEWKFLKNDAIRIFLCPDPQNKRRCRPNEIILELSKLGMLSETLKCFKEALSSHNIAIALMVDLMKAERTEGWVWVQGCCKNSRGQEEPVHSWLEYDGWDIELIPNIPLGNDKFPVLIVDKRISQDARKGYSARIERNAREVKKYLKRYIENN